MDISLENKLMPATLQNSLFCLTWRYFNLEEDQILVLLTFGKCTRFTFYINLEDLFLDSS